MKGMTLCKFLLGSIVSLGILGCATMPDREPFVLNPVAPRGAESIDLDQVMVLVDASGSMKSTEKFPYEKSLVESFAAGMPDGKYESGLASFGGTASSRWLMLPLKKFNRARMTDGAADVKYLGGSTTMDMALAMDRRCFSRTQGKAALLIFSDGRVPRKEAVMSACAMLMRVHRGDVCIHTIQIGDDPKGETFLRQLSRMSGCGSYRMAADADDPAGMEDLIREVFFGMAKDSDGDGVPDKQDQCPDTPKGVKVDKVGCPLDSDGDGVPDYKDKCPDTPKGVKVDKVGCPLDSDGDGVPDYQDKCPDTPKGAKVDKRGCWTLKGLNFDTNKYNIKPEFEGRLKEVAEVLKKNPQVHIRIDGHTDSVGMDADNQTLSDNRAKAVQQYLVDHGIAADRLKAMGFGEAKPIKPNDTAENMYMNRRVELTVVE